MPDTSHIILMMADHLRADCLSCYGNLGVNTPHLDAMADQSVVFDRAYCSTPLCVPTRTSMATGKWPHTTGCIVNGGRSTEEKPWAQVGADERTYYEHLADAGYAITHSGVSHVRSAKPIEERVPNAKFIGAEGFQALRDAGYELPHRDEWWKPVPEWCNGSPTVRMSASPMYVETVPFDASLFPDKVWAQRMVEEIEKADPNEPRFWVLHLWAPHPPYWIPEPYASMYDPEAIALPANVGRWYEASPAHLLHGSNAQGSQFMPDDWRRTWAAYFGLTTMVDDCIGQVIDAFKAKGIWDDAMAMFTQDHGENLGGHGCFQKMTLYEDSARVPMLIKPPGNAHGERRANPVGHVDIADTFADYAGVEPIEGTWGSSLRTLVDDASAPWREETFSEFNGDHGRAYPSRAIITEQYKYIHHFTGAPEMYDVIADPLEEHNLIGNDAHAELASQLRKRLQQWMRDTNDLLDMDEHDDFHPAMWRQFSRDMRP